MKRVVDFNLTDPRENVAWNGVGHLVFNEDGTATAEYAVGNGVEHECPVSAQEAAELEALAGTEEGAAALIRVAVEGRYRRR